MDPVTTPLERALHLLLFVSGAIAIGVIGIAALERLMDGPHRSVRIVHVAIAATIFGAFFVAERVYHGVH